MKTIQIIPLTILKKQAQNDWAYKTSFWEGIALSLYKLKKNGKVILYTDQEGINTLINQLALPYDEVYLLEDNYQYLSDCIINTLANLDDCLWVSTDTYSLTNLNFIEKGTFYFWNQELPEMVSTSRIYQNNEKVKELFSKPHNWGGYHIFDGIFHLNQQFWRDYKIFFDSLIPENEKVTVNNPQNYDRFALRYLLSVFANKIEYKFSEGLDNIAKNNFSFDNIIESISNDLPFINASETLKSSERFADLISHWLFQESPKTFHKIREAFQSFRETDFFLRATQCSEIVKHPGRRSLLEKDIYTFEVRREKFFINSKNNVFSEISYQSLVFLSTQPLKEILDSKWRAKDNHTVLESKWKWDMRNVKEMDRHTYTKLKVIYNKTQPSGFYHTCIYVNALTKRIREENIDILEMLILYFLKSPKKARGLIRLTSNALSEREISGDFVVKCIEKMKILVKKNYIERI
jgi:hypothetical protein